MRNVIGRTLMVDCKDKMTWRGYQGAMFYEKVCVCMRECVCLLQPPPSPQCQWSPCLPWAQHTETAQNDRDKHH